MPTYTEDTSHVSSVWSAYGHRFISGDGYESCLTCGALYQLLALADDPSRGEYMAADGSEPTRCTHDTSMTHGYPGEAYCEACHGSADGCEHCNHDCNCIACNS